MRRALAPWVVLLLLASVEVVAGSRTPPTPRHPGSGSVWRLQPNAVALRVREPRLALQAVSPRELMAALESPTGSAAGVAVAGLPEGHGSAVRIQRRLEGIWTLQVPANGTSDMNQAIDVQAEVVASTGSVNRLAPRTAGEPEVDIRVVALPPLLVSRQEDGVTYEGGVLLELDLSKVHSSGTYSGTLVLTINHF